MTEQPPDPSLPQPDATQTATDMARPGRTMGPYRLLQSLGEGGMGEVWLAEQTEPVHRQVAFKVIKAGMDTKQVVARFEAERQALALMDHPAIATVFDGGSTPDGRPYFAMEYVKGEPITTYCDRQRLSTPERLELFTQVCEGVQHAHQKGIIHRDLKPSNVLVMIQDDHPVPKIIDFGVAKAMAQPLTERSLFTELGVLIGTPEYMSPEQAEMTGLDIDTRTDVYALGVMLYELLTGALPFDRQTLREGGLDAIRHTIREKEPPRPSARVASFGPDSSAAAARRRTDPARLASQLRGDLDWITLKALEKDRTRRYATANALVADIRRHLDHEPVSAGPPSAVYRARKFARRHRVGVGAAASLIVVLVAFAATMAVQAQRIARERDRANREAAAAQQVSDFLVGLFKVSDPSEARGSTITAREVLDKGAATIEQDLKNQPGVQVRLLTTMGTVYTSLGLYGAAEPMLERAVATGQRALGEESLETLKAMNGLANVYWYQGRHREAEPLYLRVVRGRQQVLGARHPDTLKAEFDLASLWALQSRLEEAERLIRTTLGTQRSVLGPEHPDTLGSLNILQNIYYRQQRYWDALPLAEEGVAARRRVLGDDHPSTLTALHNLALIYDALRRDTEAETLYLDTIAAKRKVLGASHYSTARTVYRLAAMYRRQQRYVEAEPLALEAYTSFSEALGVEHTDTQNTVKELVALYQAWGKTDKAAEWRAKLAPQSGTR